MFTVIIFEGRIARRAIGRFKTTTEAETWALADGWTLEQFRVIPFHD